MASVSNCCTSAGQFSAPLKVYSMFPEKGQPSSVAPPDPESPPVDVPPAPSAPPELSLPPVSAPPALAPPLAFRTPPEPSPPLPSSVIPPLADAPPLCGGPPPAADAPPAPTSSDVLGTPPEPSFHSSSWPGSPAQATNTTGARVNVLMRRPARPFRLTIGA